MAKLRQRILDNMPEILQIIDNGNGGPDPADTGDFRRAIVNDIRKIAELEIMPAHQERANLDKATSHLMQARKLLEKTQHYEVIDDLMMRLQASKPKASGWTVANRKRLAAMTAFDLLVHCGGDKLPTGTDGGRYHRLANLLYTTATGDRDSDLHVVCKEHIKSCKADGLYPSASEWREWKTCKVKRIGVAKEWLPLQQIVDEFLPQKQRANKAKTLKGHD